MVSSGDNFSPPEHRDRIFALIVAGTFCGQLGLSILTPFFPAEAKSKLVKDSTLGWIFSIFELATMLCTPWASRLLVKFGSKPILVAGNFLGGLANVLQGFCWYASDGPVFITSCLCLRVVAGMAFSFQSTAGYSLLTPLFGPTVSTAAGTLEGSNGLALILGPIVGSTLFTLGGGAEHFGYVLPFVVLGVAEIVFSMLNAFSLPKLPTPPSSHPSLLNFSPKALIPGFNCVVMGISLGLLSPTLQPLLAEPPLSYSIQMVGFAFAAICTVYAVMAVLVGKVDDYYEGRKALPLMATGAILVGGSFLMMGPMRLVFEGHTWELPPSRALFWTSTPFLGAGVAFGFIPVYKQFICLAKHETSEERDLAASSAFTIAVALGSFLGPTLGGELSELIGVRSTYTYMGLMEVVLFIVLVILTFVPSLRQDVRDPPLLSTGRSEELAAA